jgi:uncharacterized protein
MLRPFLAAGSMLAILSSACERVAAPAVATVGAAGETGGEKAERPAPHRIEGLWQGTLNTGAIQLRVVFKIKTKPDGSLTGTLDSIDQGAKDIPLSAVRLTGEAVQFECNAVFGVYNGKLSADGAKIVGDWKQGGISLPLTLQRVEKEIELRRPQEPKKPYPYRGEAVAYDNKKGKSHLAGTLTLPRGKGPFPAVLLITGSGQQDRDEALLGHRPFLVLADALTRRGIAVLRVDDRGVGGSTGDVTGATSVDFAGDALAGVAYLKTRREIDPKKIGLIGHSEGGLIAPMVAVRSKDVAFIVLMAGTGLTGEEIMYRQSALILKASGGTPEAIAKQCAAQERMFAVVKREKENAAAEKALREIDAEQHAPPTPDPAQASAAAKTEPQKASGQPAASQEAMLQMLLSPWFRYFLTYDPRPTLRQVKCPVLAINGEHDLQVPPKENLQAIRQALQAGGNRDVTVKELPKLNHLFQTSRTGSPAEYAQIEETIAPTALRLIGDWILRITRAHSSGVTRSGRRPFTARGSSGSAVQPALARRYLRPEG